jgi:NAD(P)H dehydrogenase (quinone)
LRYSTRAWIAGSAASSGRWSSVEQVERAIRHQENGVPEGLLAGRTGRLAVTSDSLRWYLPLVGDTTVKQVRGRSEARLAAWVREAADLGAADAAQPGRPDRLGGVRRELTAAGR